MKLSRRWRNLPFAVIFLTPSFLGLMTFVFGPMIVSFWYSFNSWNLLSPMEFIGLENFKELMKDKLWWTSLRNTVWYSVLNIPLVIAVALAMALIINKKGAKFTGFLKGIFFLPVVCSEVAISIIWQWILSSNFGLLNMVLQMLKLPPQEWLASTKLAMISVVIVVVWRWAGYEMVILLGGLNDIPEEYYEAAKIDGANGRQQFIYITMPLLRPILFFISTTCLIGSFQTFDIIYMLTRGGPGSSTYLTGYYLYQNAFSFLKMGYASAVAVCLFFILLVLTALQMRVRAYG